MCMCACHINKLDPPTDEVGGLVTEDLEADGLVIEAVARDGVDGLDKCGSRWLRAASGVGVQVWHSHASVCVLRTVCVCRFDLVWINDPT